MQRLEKLLEDAQIKLSSVVTDLCGVASRRILTALMSGVTDPAAPVLLRGGLKVSAADLTEALTLDPVRSPMLESHLPGGVEEHIDDCPL